MIRISPLRSRAPWLTAAVLFFAASLAWLVSFEVLYVRRAEARKKLVSENEGKILLLQSDLRRRRGEFDRIRALGTDRERLYHEIFGTSEARFTDRIRRIRKLAAEASLRISSLAFSENNSKEFPARIVDIRFSTEGRYSNFKRFLNSLELDREFLSLTGVGMSRNDPAAGRSEVGLAISMRTAFYDPSGVTRKRVLPPKAGTPATSVLPDKTELEK